MKSKMPTPMQQVSLPPQQPSMPPAQAVQQSQQQPPSQEQKFNNNLDKVKYLVGPLKETLANTMKIAAQNVYQNATVDSGLKTIDAPIPRFDKSLEEFYAICDQIELNLKTALEYSTLTSSSQRYTPIPMTKSDGGPDNLGYSQYVNTVRTQISYAKEIHEALSNAARNITGNE